MPVDRDKNNFVIGKRKPEARLHGKLIDNVAEIMLPSEVRYISFCKYNYVYMNMSVYICIYCSNLT
ncbi:hypothetical protein YC2023_099256 [Brassica napus]